MNDNFTLAYLIILVFTLLAYTLVNRRFNKYSGTMAACDMTAREVAKKILQDAGLTDVDVKYLSSAGLSDHYAPSQKTLWLSENVINSKSIAAIGIAAHEAAHAIQHAENYKPLVFRNANVNMASVGSRFGVLLLIIGLYFSITPVSYVGIILYSFVVLFTLLTLPVEFNASQRAIAILRDSSILTESELPGAKSVLSAAAMTYVAAVLAAVLQLFRMISRIRRSGKDD